MDFIYLFVNVMPWFYGSRDTNASTSSMTDEERRKQQKKEEALHASSLQVPRRHYSFLVKIYNGNLGNSFFNDK